MRDFSVLRPTGDSILTAGCRTVPHVPLVTQFWGMLFVKIDLGRPLQCSYSLLLSLIIFILSISALPPLALRPLRSTSLAGLILSALCGPRKLI
jgi:hypothetical protein